MEEECEPRFPKVEIIMKVEGIQTSATSQTVEPFLMILKCSLLSFYHVWAFENKQGHIKVAEI